MPLDPLSSLTRLFNAPVKPGALTWIGVRPERRLAMCLVQDVILDPHSGMEGDHYSRDAGNRQVTLIQAESIAAIASHLGIDTVAPEMLRRNLVTRGIDLLPLAINGFNHLKQVVGQRKSIIEFAGASFLAPRR